MAAACGVVGAHHEPIRMQAVAHGGPLAQELGIGDDTDVGTADDLLDQGGRADRDGRLVDDDGAVLQQGPHLLGRRLHEGEIGRPVVALGRGHAQEDELRRPATASAAEAVKRRLPAATPSATSSSSPISTIGIRPLRSAARRAGSRSASTTRWPKWASVAAVGRPT